MRAPLLSALLLIAALAALAGCDGEVELSVDLKTDLVPGVEFTTVRTRLLPSGAFQERGAFRGDAFQDGGRVGEFPGLETGSIEVELELLDLDGETVTSRRVRLTLESSYGLTVLITRDCAGLVCPDSAGEPGFDECFGGTCTTSECSERDRSACPPVECMADGDCRDGAACAVADCDLGRCVYPPDDASCAAGEYCNPAVGCLAEPPSDDSGMLCDFGLTPPELPVNPRSFALQVNGTGYDAHIGQLIYLAIFQTSVSVEFPVAIVSHVIDAATFTMTFDDVMGREPAAVHIYVDEDEDQRCSDGEFQDEIATVEDAGGTHILNTIRGASMSLVCDVYPYPGDINRDGCVDIADANALLTAFTSGLTGWGYPADVDFSGMVNANDHSYLLGNACSCEGG